MTEQRERDRNPRRGGAPVPEAPVPEGPEYQDKIVHIARVAKVVKGGRRFSFSALVVVGDGKGMVGFALGKANEFADAIRKGNERARKALVRVPLIDARTVPHEVVGEFESTKVIMRPASAGTGVIAGGAVRAVMEMAGVHDVLTKVIGSRNPHNVVKATMEGLTQLRSAEDVAQKRGKSIEDLTHA